LGGGEVMFAGECGGVFVQARAGFAVLEGEIASFLAGAAELLLEVGFVHGVVIELLK